MFLIYMYTHTYSNISIYILMLDQILNHDDYRLLQIDKFLIDVLLYLSITLSSNIILLGKCRLLGELQMTVE